MSGLLYGAGAAAVMVGVVMVGFGIPINEFSFGNTLIGAGTTAAVGGLIVIALGVVVAQLHRINAALATRAPIRSGRPLDIFENAAGSRAAPAPGRIPFPPKLKADAAIREPHPLDQRMDAAAPADMPAEERPTESFAPTLRNPDEPPVTVEDDVSLSPWHPMATPEPAAADLNEPAPVPSASPRIGVNGSGMAENRHEPALDAGWRSPPPPTAPEQTRQPHTAYFDAMWPAEPKPAKNSAGTEAKPYEPKLDLPPRESAAAPSERAEPEAPMLPPGSEPRAVAILKSGVVDGMGYTLYVDGSIEAELPQGTLHFASINELRSHLEKNS
jgi:hypothetical protein